MSKVFASYRPSKTLQSRCQKKQTTMVCLNEPKNVESSIEHIKYTEHLRLDQII